MQKPAILILAETFAQSIDDNCLICPVERACDKELTCAENLVEWATEQAVKGGA